MKNIVKVLVCLTVMVAVTLSVIGASRKNDEKNVNSTKLNKVNRNLQLSFDDPFGCWGSSTFEPFSTDLVYEIDLGTGGLNCDPWDPFAGIFGGGFSSDYGGGKWSCVRDVAFPNGCVYKCKRYKNGVYEEKYTQRTKEQNDKGVYVCPSSSGVTNQENIGN